MAPDLITFSHNMLQVNAKQEEYTNRRVPQITKWHVRYKFKMRFLKESERYVKFLMKQFYFHMMCQIQYVSYSHFSFSVSIEHAFSCT